jgi:hypothetical protein
MLKCKTVIARECASIPIVSTLSCNQIRNEGLMSDAANAVTNHGGNRVNESQKQEEERQW